MAPESPIDIEQSIKRFASDYELDFRDAMRALSRKQSLEVAADFLGWRRDGEPASTSDLEALGSFLDHRGYPPPKLRGYVLNQSRPNARRSTKPKEELEMALTKEQYEQFVEQGLDLEKIAAIAGLKTSSLKVMVSKWGLSRPDTKSLVAGITNTGGNENTGLEEAIHSAAREAGKLAAKQSSSEYLPFPANIPTPPVTLETGENTDDVVESAASEKVAFVTIRIPLSDTIATNDSVESVSEDIQEAIKSLDQAFSRVSFAIRHLLDVEDTTEYVQRYVDRQIANL